MAISNNTFDVNAAAAAIIAPMREAEKLAKDKKEAGADFTAKVNSTTLTAYAECVLLIARMEAQGNWKTGKGGAMPSASKTLQEALANPPGGEGISGSKAKRLVEKSSAVLFAKGKRLPGVVEAAAKGEGKASRVVEAFAVDGISKEADLIRHVEPKPETDPVALILKKVGKLSDEQRDELRARLNEASREDGEEERKEERAPVAAAPRRGGARGAGRVAKPAKAEKNAEAKVDPFAA